jgi:hypothetical protein
LSQSPGEVPGFGPLDADDCRSLGKAMVAHPRTRWCLTITDENGHPIAHGCARRRRGPPPTQDPVPPTGCGATPTGDRGPTAGDRAPPSGDRPSPTGDCAPATGGPIPLSARPGQSVPRDPEQPVPRRLERPVSGRPEGPARDPGLAECDAPRDGRPGPVAIAAGGPGRGAAPGWDAGLAAWAAGLELQWLESGACTHRRESAGYRPPPSLQHLIRVRQQTCAFPGCGRPARRCDLDHTVPYEDGGRTCLCNLAPLCRRHHQAKQADGWRLEQPQPGILTWTTPSGRRYTTHPTIYPE